MIQKNWDVFQTALCQSAKPMNTQSVSSSIKYWCFSNLPQRQETKMITVLSRLDFFLTSVIISSRKITPMLRKQALHLSGFFCVFLFFVLFFLDDVSHLHYSSVSEKGTERLIHKASKHSLQGPVPTMVTAKKSFQTLLILKVLAITRGRKWALSEVAGVFWGQQCFVFNEAQLQVSNSVPQESETSEDFSILSEASPWR